MFMSVVAPVPGVSVYPELAGARVLITGLSSAQGVDVARAFADHKTRLVLQTCETSPEMTELASILARETAEIRLFERANSPDATRFAQTAVSAFGGLDAVVNLISLSRNDLEGVESLAAIEDLVSEKLLPATLITRVAANRMALTWTVGSILNVVQMPAPQNEREAALAGITRTALAALTRGEAQAVSDKAVRINAVGPRAVVSNEPAGAVLSTGPEIASLALHLASHRGRQLTGHVFDAEQVVVRGC